MCFVHFKIYLPNDGVLYFIFQRIPKTKKNTYKNNNNKIETEIFIFYNIRPFEETH
uniref:Candidate secreted effector n=1 Tax=Meloidogyne incognita TaxID=6306 RepID=A0A914P2H4_MELIC